MGQLHARFTSEQVRLFMFEACVRGTMSRKGIQETPKVGKTRFFALAMEYRLDAQGSSVSYKHESPGRVGPVSEVQI